MVETFLLHLQLFIRISDLLPDRHHQITWRFLIFVEVVGHHILHTAELTLLAHVEVTHDNHINIVAAHQIHEGVLLVLWQVGGRCGGVIIRGAEQPVVTDDEAVTIVLAMRELLLQPFQLAFAMCAVARIEENVQIFESTNSLYRHSISRSVEILFVEFGAIKIEIVVAQNGEAGVILGLCFCIETHGGRYPLITRFAA